jgi:hypothetical protein
MKQPADGWDRDEREALDPVADEIAALRECHANDPPLDLLRAAHADALPPDLQARVSDHLADSAWSRALVDGANDVEHSLDAPASDRLFARIAQSTTPRPPLFSAIRFGSRVLAAAAALIIIAALWVSWRGTVPAAPPSTSAAPQSTVARTEPPPFELPLRKPDVRLSVSALTWRGPSGAASLVDDLAPALDTFRASDYARAAQMLEPIGRQYPKAFEPRFYRGISLLFLNDASGAIDELQTAAQLADSSFSSDVAWYLAVAEARAGRLATARVYLDPLCRTANAHAADACDAIKKLDGAR